jgi:hypothetical protein
MKTNNTMMKTIRETTRDGGSYAFGSGFESQGAQCKRLSISWLRAFLMCCRSIFRSKSAFLLGFLVGLFGLAYGAVSWMEAEAGPSPLGALCLVGAVFFLGSIAGAVQVMVWLDVDARDAREGRL